MILKKIMGVLCASFLLGPFTGSAMEVMVMSYNVRYDTTQDGANSWTHRRDLMIDQLREASPGTLGLQEALRSQIDDLRAALPHYGEAGIGRDGGEAGEYSCILYDTRQFDLRDSGTFWLSETPDRPSRDWESACPRVCTWALLADKKTGETFYHFNTHLDHESAQARLNGIRLILQRIAARGSAAPFVLTGDLNASETDPVLAYVLGAEAAPAGARPPLEVVDTFRILHPDATETGTFNGFVGDRSGGKIDYVLTSPVVGVIEAGIDHSMPGGRCISDHFPVYARLQFAPQPSAEASPQAPSL